MVRIALLLAVITVLSLGAAWLGDEPGHVAIDWSDYHIETSLLVLLAAVALLSLACVVAYLLFFAIVRSPGGWMRSRAAKRQSLGLTALTEAFTAIATQDIRSAKKQLAKAQHYMPQQPLTLMLAAQTARMEGDESKARLYLERLLATDGGEYMATRSLIENARRNNDPAAAVSYAEKALSLKPSDAWTATTLIALYSKLGRSQQALQLIALSARRRALTKAEARKFNAYVLFESASGLIADGRDDAAVPALVDSLYNLPGFVPSAALLGVTYFTFKEPKLALKAISAAWKKTPHVALTRALLKGWDTGTDSDQKAIIKAARKLAQMHLQHNESQYLLAEMAMRSLDRDAARGHIQHLLGTRPTLRGCTLMAELEQIAGNPGEAAVWLKRAASAPADAAYSCDNCNHPADHWQFLCPNCSGVATLRAA
jgi:HemY protein